MKLCPQLHIVVFAISITTLFSSIGATADVHPGDIVTIEYLDGKKATIQIGRLETNYIFVKTQSGGYNIYAIDLSDTTLRDLGMTDALRQREEDRRQAEFERTQKETGLVEFRGRWITPTQKQEILEQEQTEARKGAVQAKTEAAAKSKAQAEAREKTEGKVAYEAGYQDGYLVGKSDKQRGEKPDMGKAKRLGKIHGKSSSKPEQYARGYYEGYTNGWLGDDLY